MCIAAHSRCVCVNKFIMYISKDLREQCARRAISHMTRSVQQTHTCTCYTSIECTQTHMGPMWLSLCAAQKAPTTRQRRRGTAERRLRSHVVCVGTYTGEIGFAGSTQAHAGASLGRSALEMYRYRMYSLCVHVLWCEGKLGVAHIEPVRECVNECEEAVNFCENYRVN